MKINFVKLIKINIYLTCFKLLEILNQMDLGLQQHLTWSY